MKEITSSPSTALNGVVSRLDRVQVMAAVFGIGLTAFLAVEPTQNWLLLLLAGLVALGTDALVRSHPRSRFQRLDDTALYLFVPVLLTLSLGLFLEEAVGGYWSILAGLGAAIPFALVLQAEYNSVDRRLRAYGSARLILNIATYVIAFLFYAAVYDFDLNLPAVIFASGIVSVLLAIEILREEALETPRTLLYALAIGVLLAEAALAMHFLPLEGALAAVFLLLAFYLMTGLMHNYLADRLTLHTAGEFSGIALLGLLIVVVSHAYV